MTLDNRSILQIQDELQGAIQLNRELLQDHDLSYQITKENINSRTSQLLDRLATHDFKVQIDCIAKELLYGIVNSTEEDEPTVDNTSIIRNETTTNETLLSFYALFDLTLVLAEAGITEQTLPLSLIEEAFDTQTIDGCQRLFAYMESRFERLTVGVDGSKGKGIVLLRLANELLRRLSKSEDTVFCGRILVFLSKSFPLSEKSGVNLRGEFNVENRTMFDTTPTVDEDAMEIISTDEALTDTNKTEQAERKDTEAKAVTDAELDRFYTIFWSMQNDFADPTRLFIQENMKAFQTSLAATIQLFKAITGEQSAGNASGSTTEPKRGEKRKRGDEESLDHYNPKYLTSRELFKLEVRDLVFRRHILVQSYILIDFLLNLTTDAKKNWEIENKNRSLQFAYTLEDNDLKWCEDTKREVWQSLQNQKGMDGLLFSRTVESVLTREKNWVKWKANNCVSFERNPITEPEFLKSSTQISTSSQRPPVSPYSLGAPSLSKVWNEEKGNDGLQGLRGDQRFSVPSHKSFQKTIESAELDLDFASSGQEKENLTNVMSSSTWKALRVASKDRFYLFQKLDDDLSLKSLVGAEEQYLKDKKEKSSATDTKVMDDT